MNPLALDVKDLCVNLSGQRVLDHVSFHVTPGEFVGITGPNGGGKSTLLRAMLGLVPTCCGRVEFAGQALHDYQRGHSIGYVPQNAAHVDAAFPATAREVVAMGTLATRRWPWAPKRTGSVQDALQATGVAHLANRRIGEMSGGQRQRVLLAKALVANPQLLILDEPTTGVDAGARDAFAHLISDLNHQHGMTVLLVSHDTDILHHTANRLLVIDGTVVDDASANRVASTLEKLHAGAAA